MSMDDKCVTSAPPAAADGGTFVGMLRNAGAALIGRLFAIPIEIIAFALVARALQVERMGVFTFAVEYSVMFSYLLAGFGILATRELAAQPRERGEIFGSLAILFVLVGAVLYALMLFTGRWFTADARGWEVLAILGGAQFVLAGLVVLGGVFRGFERMRYEGLLAFLQPTAYLGLVLAGVFLLGCGDDLAYMAWSVLASCLLALVVGYAIMRLRLLRPVWVWSPARLRAYGRAVIPLGIAFVLFTTYGRVSILFLQSVGTSGDVGLFNVAFRLAQNIGVIPFLLAGAWLPTLARHAGGDGRAFGDHALDLYRVLLFLGVGFAVGVGLLAEPIVRLLFGEAYRPSAAVLRVLVWTSCLFFFNFAGKTVFDAVGRQSRWILALVLGVIVCAALSAWLVPLHAGLGAAYAMLGASLVVTGVTLLAVGPHIPWRRLPALVGRVAVAGAGAGAVIVVLRPISWVAAGIAGALAYVLLSALTRVIRLGGKGA